MRAAACLRYGSAEDALEIIDAPRPAPGRGAVLVRNLASSLNPIDARKRAGYGRALFEKRRRPLFPWILGSDVSGVVEAVGPGARRFRPGDAVFGAVAPFAPGAHADYVALLETHLAPRPAALSAAEAAALPYAALTAWAALVGAAGLRPGDGAGRLAFVNGASGGVGAVATQLLNAWGWRVAATCSESKADLVRGLGAETVIDHRAEDFTTRLSAVDLALDAVGDAAEDGEARVESILRPGGVQVTLVHPLARMMDARGVALGGATAAAEYARRRARHRGRYRWALYRPDGAALRTMAAMVDAGALRPVIGAALPLDRIAEAHERVERGDGPGKTVLMIDPDTDKPRIDPVS
jgi:NADPH:quinone reductase-like Zn-dependent oxidoreductase